MTLSVGEMLYKLAGRVDKRASRKTLTGPWIVKFPKFSEPRQDWAVATDFLAMVWAVNWRPTLIQDLPIEDDKSEVRRKLLPYFDEPRGGATVAMTRVAALREFAGGAVWDEQCPACKGMSAGSDYVLCSFCESDGVIWPEMSGGFIGGHPIDRSRLALVLQPFPDATVKVVVGEPLVKTKGKDGMCLWFLSADFRIMLMGIDPKVPLDETRDDYEMWQTAPDLLRG